MRTSPVERLAGVVLAAEGIGILVLAGWELIALLGGDTDSLVSSIALLVLTVVGAAVVLAFAVSTARGASWGRSGGIVTQLLALAVAFGALTGPEAQPATAALIAVPAVLGLVLLISSVRVSARRREAD